MKCQKCGAELPEGKLYCEKCGEEVHIVPDFEPEIENSIHESLSGIVEKALGEDDEHEENTHHKKRNIIIGAAVLLFLLIFTGLILFYFWTNSYTYQIKKAENCCQNGKLEKAIVYYEKAVSMGFKI